MRLRAVMVGILLLTCVVTSMQIAALPAAALDDPPGADWHGVFSVEDRGPDGKGSAAPGAACEFQGREIPCSAKGKWWYSTRECYGGRLASSTVKVGDLIGGLDHPGGPEVTTFQPDWVHITCGSYWCYFDDIEPPPDRPGRDAGACDTEFFYDVSARATPEMLARRAMADMDLRAPEIGLTGYGKPESLQLLGLPTWMWAADPGDSTTGPVDRSASEDGLTVTATGRLTATVWQMGDGSVVTCEGTNAAGTPYDSSYGGSPSPTCGYQYGWTSAREPGKAFTVTVTANWTVDWEGGDQSGVLTTSVVRSTQLRVGEVQVITDQRGDRL